MIKKYLVLMMAFSLMFGVVGVIAEDQGVEVIVSPTSSASINPTTLNFGTILPGTPNLLEDAITFSADAGSNEDMTITVTGVTGIFANNIDVSIADAATFGPLESFTDVLECVIVSEVCTYTDIVLDATLDVPPGTPAGDQTGTISYLLTGAPPTG